MHNSLEIEEREKIIHALLSIAFIKKKKSISGACMPSKSRQNNY